MDSHIEERIFKEGRNPKGGRYSILLNKVVNIWAGTYREQKEEDPEGWGKQYFY